MGTNKIIYALLVVVFINALLPAQAEYVPSDHIVYDFLNRMDSHHLISGFNSIEKPFTRNHIAIRLSELMTKKSELTEIDQKMLEDFIIEFEYDIYGTTNNSTYLFGPSKYNHLSQQEKYLYYSVDSSGNSIFTNFIGNFRHIPYYDYSDGLSANASFLQYGGLLRGTLLNRIGFYIKGSNGKIWGDRSAALTMNQLRFNYKYNTDPELHTAIDYIDDTEGHLSADFEYVTFKLGRDYKQIGFGQINYILGNNIPKFDYISFELKYKMFSFSYFHGKLLGVQNNRTDSVQGAIREITDKYIAYHRAAFDVSRHVALGFGELAVYSNRSMDFSYLNPFNFYKSVEHANQDRDNSLLFLDIKNNTIKGLKIVGALLIDDIDFSKLGTSWFGNQLLYNISIYSSNLNRFFPLDLSFQYLRVDPYVFTHRIHDNNYTHNSYSLAAPIQPNSEMFAVGFNYRPTYRIMFNLSIKYSEHGANVIDESGKLLRNVGGDVIVGHRETDQVEAPFLDGNKEHLRSLTFDTVFEPYNNYFISGRLLYENNSLQYTHLNFLAGYIVFDIRI